MIGFEEHILFIINYKKCLCPPPLIQRPLLVGDVSCEGEHPGYRLLACTDKQIKGFSNIFCHEMIFYCTAGHEGAVADISCMSIFSACFGLPTIVQLPATTWSGQIWISGWILPHFDVRTISVA